MKSNNKKMQETCLVKDCNNLPHAKGFCCKHYHRLVKYGNPTHIPDPVETKRKQSAAAKGRIPWSKGKIGVYSEESLRKMREGHKKNPSPSLFKKGKENIMFGKTGKQNPMFGKKHTEEAKKKVSVANTGRKHSEESRKKMSLGQRRKKLSETAKKNISESKKGKKNPMYGKSGKLAPMFGKKASEETRKKQSIFSKEFHNRPEEKERSRQNLRKTRKNQVKPNQKELQIMKILNDNRIKYEAFAQMEFGNIHHEVDFLIGDDKIIEHNGTYFHADPRKYAHDEKIFEKKAIDVWKKDQLVIEQMKQAGYKVLVIWEFDLMNNFEKTVQKILKFIEIGF
jgi:G:T-mismatch repair DNA endonuclease (very short patch repair protein)